LTVWAADASLDKFPEKAKAALLKLAGDNKITEVEMEKEHGIQVYEASWLVDGKKHEAEVTADGVLLELEESVDSDKVPEAVRTAAGKALPGDQKLRYEKHTIVLYEVKGKVDGKNKEIAINPGGKIAGQEEDDDDDKEDDK
jgi:hypothetical protein